MRRFLPALLWALFIFFLSDQPKLPTPPIAFEGLDKLIHAGFYGVLAGLLWWADRGQIRRAWVWVGACVLYGASDEFHQCFVPHRKADLLDLLADTAGAALAMALLLKLAARKPKSTELQKGCTYDPTL